MAYLSIARIVNRLMLIHTCLCQQSSFASKIGIIATDAIRMMVTNRAQASFEREILFFEKKLSARSFPVRVIN